MLRLLPVFLAVAIWVYALVDCARTPEDEMPYRVPKVVWIILVVVFPFVGAVAWIIVSRVARSQNGGGSGVWSSGPPKPGRPSAPSGPRAPDDDPEFLFRIEQRRRREAAAERRRQAEKRGEKPGHDSAGGGDAREGGAPGTGAHGGSADEPGEGNPGPSGGSAPDVDSSR
ncbi:PLD nuclease N-terminal domain-containing protein [Bogoriella caseilytica]|uniref:Phospholipase D-like protein n=1 Tax=Bogoriella caseilytica TaxID=56055 RepID=A0A3N2BAY2_9MICO|nr:PLD nuclease N-terminal domain-containing protein [Bogoriella caseilytica]ROR72332.1 phospholipase D-like protein [Bogoriella caseilytica]